MDYGHILCFISFWTSLTVVSSAMLSISTDEAALHALRAHIDSSFDTQNLLSTNWSMSTSVCEWVGVTCKRNRVTALNISSMGLRGTIPPQLGNLSALVSLDLSRNDFYEEIPSSFGCLSQLRELLLCYNHLSGPIPSTLTNLTSLEALDLYSNILKGEIPEEFGKLKNLEYLNLANNTLVGYIPDPIFNITSLTVFSLGYNQLTGGISTNVGRLVNLKVLSFAYNHLTGPIPPSVFNMSSLGQLALYRNALTGTVPPDLCRQLPTVQTLALSDNLLTGKIPPSIGNCTLLMELYLGNKMSGGIPEEISRLSKLRVLNLDWNGLGGQIPPSIFNMSKLSRLMLMSNNLSGTLPSTVGINLPNVEYFCLANNRLSGVIPSSMSNASKLTHLEFSQNMFSGSLPSWIGSLGQLEALHLAVNNLTNEPSPVDHFFTSLSNCRKLTDVWIAENPLNGHLPPSIGNLSSLMRLNISRSGIVGTIPDLKNLSSLSMLDLSQNYLTGSIVPTWREGLERLLLSDNKISGPIPASLCLMKQLWSLYLDQNELIGQLPNCFGNLTNLRYLRLASNRLISPIPHSFWGVGYILQLDLSSNSFTNSLPTEIGNLKHLVFLNLSHNQFTGGLPSSIKDLISLEVLSLADNNLQGPIPESFSKLISLVTLDLSQNQLNETIPKSLEGLSYLEQFNVSYNRLTGEIPTKGPFEHFNVTSFWSNEGLCGGPKFELRSCAPKSHNKSSNKKLLFVVYILVITASLLLGFILVIWLVIKLRKNKDATKATHFSQELPNERIVYSQLYQATDGFHASNLLGMGSYGSVYKGFLEGSIYAIKVFNLQVQGGFCSFNKECEILRNLRHRNLTKVFTSYSNVDFKALILEYMCNGSLEKWLYSENYDLDVLQRIEIMIDVGCALDYLHNGSSTPIVHCDLKPSNILLDKNMVAHVSDFGIAKMLGGAQDLVQTNTLGTFGYMAPEYGSEGRVSIKGDVYSYGIVLMEIFTRKKPTDDAFSGDLSLKRWVTDSLSEKVIEVIDCNLIKPDDVNLHGKVRCLKAIMELAITCVAESPLERKEIKDVLATLQNIKAKFISK